MLRLDDDLSIRRSASAVRSISAFNRADLVSTGGGDARPGPSSGAELRASNKKARSSRGEALRGERATSREGEPREDKGEMGGVSLLVLDVLRGDSGRVISSDGRE